MIDTWPCVRFSRNPSTRGTRRDLSVEAPTRVRFPIASPQSCNVQATARGLTANCVCLASQMNPFSHAISGAGSNLRGTAGTEVTTLQSPDAVVNKIMKALQQRDCGCATQHAILGGSGRITNEQRRRVDRGHSPGAFRVFIASSAGPTLPVRVPGVVCGQPRNGDGRRPCASRGYSVIAAAMLRPAA